MLELIAPAGSQESVIAGVQNGADAIYFSIGGGAVGQDGNSFSREDVEYAARYCRMRGCKTYAALNTLIYDNELDEAASLARNAVEMGVDAIIVQDMGLMRVLRRVIPDVPLIAGRRMGIDNLPGVEAAAFMGAAEVSLSRELSLEQIEYIARHTSTALMVSVHGELCVSKQGNCYMSALLEKSPANRGICAKICRRDYSAGGRKDDHPLSLKDNCLIKHLEALERIGVKSVMIEGRAKRPEYAAHVTGVFSRAIRDKRRAAQSELQIIEDLLSRHGLTDGYFTADPDADMFGIPKKETPKLFNLFDSDGSGRFFNETRRSYLNAESHRVSISVYALICAGQPVAFGAEDGAGNKVSVIGPPPQEADILELTAEDVDEILLQTAGTPYRIHDISSLVEPGLYVEPSSLHELRQMLFKKLSERRMLLPQHKQGAFPQPPVSVSVPEQPVCIYEVSSAAQLTAELAELAADYIYVPLEIYVSDYEKTLPFTEAGTKTVVVLPASVTDGQSGELSDLLRKARNLGAVEALAGDMGVAAYANAEGFQLRGDYALNICNSYSLKMLEEVGFISATASFELTIEKIRDLKKPINTEIIAYGRLPLMLTKHCLIKRSSGRCSCHNVNNLRDDRGLLFPIMREFGCKNMIFSADKLYLADRSSDYLDAGLWGLRLWFTTENPRECAAVARSYLGMTSYRPNGLMRGMYYQR